MVKYLEDIFLFPGSLEELNSIPNNRYYKIISTTPVKIEKSFNNFDEIEIHFKQVLKNAGFCGVIRYSILPVPKHLGGVLNSDIYCNFYVSGLPVV